MKKIIALLIIIIGFSPLLHAMDGCNQQRLTPQEFRDKQKEYITERAGLTKEEADKFFPIYFELQDRKKELNDKAWKLIHQGRDEDTTEAQYREILDGVYDARIASDRLEKVYYERFKRILPSNKIYQVLRAEMRFHRELIKEVNLKRGERCRK